MYCSPHPSAHLKPGRAKHCLPWVEEFQRSLQFGPDNSPKQQVHKLKAVLPDPRSLQSTLKKGFSEPTTSNSEIIPVQVRAGRGANLPTPVATEGHGQGRTRPAVCSSVLSSKDKSGNEGRKPRMHREGEEWVLLLHFQGQAVPFCFWHTFPDKKPMFSPQTYSSTLVTTAYETIVCKDARLHANGLEILWRVSQKSDTGQLNSGRGDRSKFSKDGGRKDANSSYTQAFQNWTRLPQAHWISAVLPHALHGKAALDVCF